jgi:hypothetical protein
VTVVSRSLDDLDRLAFRLSRIVRTQYPQLLTQGFTLADLEERLLPYREVRREMAHSGPDAFESSVLRLVSGERGYVVTEGSLQAACQKALLMPSPSLSLIRSWSTTQLRLGASQATPSSSDSVPSDGQRLRPGTASSPSEGGATAAPSPSPSSDELFPMPSGTTTVAVACCRYCDNRLPTQRTVTFCPHCGMDLTKKQCPACSTELEAAWKHCVTCGRKD